MKASPGVRQVALLGGSFDPVHLGHIALAQAALKQLPLDELWWVPVGHAWQKSRALTPAVHRLAMLELAIGCDPRQRIECCEVNRQGPTYTIDTLEELRAQHPGVVWHLVLGWDQFVNLPSWRRWEEVLARVKLAVAPRPSDGKPEARQVAAGHREGPPASALPMVLQSVPITHLHLAPWEVSSTAIRADAARGRPLLDRVSAPVARYIADQGLYREAP